MYDEIAKIVFDYSKNNLILDSKAIEIIISIIIKYNNLNEYVRSINFNNNLFSGIDYLGYYNRIKKELSINEASFKYLFLTFNYKDCLFLNLNILLVILHEIDHVKLHKDVSKNSKNIDAYLNTIINTYTNNIILIMKGKKQLTKLNNYKKIYSQHHDMDPKERRANINSHIELNNIINLLQNSSISTTSINNSIYLLLILFIEYCLKGYKLDKKGITNSPSYDYIKLVGLKNKLSSIDIYCNNPLKAYINAKNEYSLQERILYGLPLNKEELEQINENDNPFKIYTKKV